MPITRISDAAIRGQQAVTYPSEGNAHVTTSAANVYDLAAADLVPWVAFLEVFEMSFHYTN